MFVPGYIFRGEDGALSLFDFDSLLEPDSYVSPSQRAILRAMVRGDVDSAREIVDSYAVNINIRYSPACTTLLHIAAIYEHTEVAELLLAQDEIEVGITDYCGNTCLDLLRGLDVEVRSELTPRMQHHAPSPVVVFPESEVPVLAVELKEALAYNTNALFLEYKDYEEARLYSAYSKNEAATESLSRSRGRLIELTQKVPLLLYNVHFGFVQHSNLVPAELLKLRVAAAELKFTMLFIHMCLKDEKRAPTKDEIHEEFEEMISQRPGRFGLDEIESNSKLHRVFKDISAVVQGKILLHRAKAELAYQETGGYFYNLLYRSRIQGAWCSIQDISKDLEQLNARLRGSMEYFLADEPTQAPVAPSASPPPPAPSPAPSPALVPVPVSSYRPSDLYYGLGLTHSFAVSPFALAPSYGQSSLYYGGRSSPTSSHAAPIHAAGLLMQQQQLQNMGLSQYQIEITRAARAATDFSSTPDQSYDSLLLSMAQTEGELFTLYKDYEKAIRDHQYYGTNETEEKLNVCSAMLGSKFAVIGHQLILVTGFKLCSADNTLTIAEEVKLRAAASRLMLMSICMGEYDLTDEELIEEAILRRVYFSWYREEMPVLEALAKEIMAEVDFRFVKAHLEHIKGSEELRSNVERIFGVEALLMSIMSSLGERRSAAANEISLFIEAAQDAAQDSVWRAEFTVAARAAARAAVALAPSLPAVALAPSLPAVALEADAWVAARTAAAAHVAAWDAIHVEIIQAAAARATTDVASMIASDSQPASYSSSC